MSLLTHNIIAVAGRFSTTIEFYSGHRMCGKIDTGSAQGVKVMLVMLNESQFTLIVGMYAEETSLMSFDISVTKDNQVNGKMAITFMRADYDTKAAVTCLKELYNQDYFVVGFSSGTVATYSRNKSEAVHIIKNLYEVAVSGISMVEVGKIYFSWSGDISRFHYVSRLTCDQQSISPVKHLPCRTLCVQVVQSLVEEERNPLQLLHVICGELKESAYQSSDTREQGIRFLRVMREDTRLSLVEEGALSNFRDGGSTSNSVQELIIVEPRKRMSRLWLVVLG